MAKNNKTVKVDGKEIQIQRNRYGCMINLYKDGEVSIVLDLDKQINHYTAKQRVDIYDAVVKTFENFLLKGGKGTKLKK